MGYKYKTTFSTWHLMVVSTRWELDKVISSKYLNLIFMICWLKNWMMVECIMLGILSSFQTIWLHSNKAVREVVPLIVILFMV